MDIAIFGNPRMVSSICVVLITREVDKTNRPWISKKMRKYACRYVDKVNSIKDILSLVAVKGIAEYRIAGSWYIEIKFIILNKGDTYV